MLEYVHAWLRDLLHLTIDLSRFFKYNTQRDLFSLVCSWLWWQQSSMSWSPSIWMHWKKVEISWDWCAMLVYYSLPFPIVYLHSIFILFIVGLIAHWYMLGGLLTAIVLSFLTPIANLVDIPIDQAALFMLRPLLFTHSCPFTSIHILQISIAKTGDTSSLSVPWNFLCMHVLLLLSRWMCSYSFSSFNQWPIILCTYWLYNRGIQLFIMGGVWSSFGSVLILC